MRLWQKGGGNLRAGATTDSEASDECLLLQGHDREVREVEEEATPGDDQRPAGLAGRGVAVAATTEAARRALAALTRAAAPPEDRCGGGKHRYTTANLRLGERGTSMPEAAEDCWELYVHEGRTKARDTAERMGKADFHLMAW